MATTKSFTVKIGADTTDFVKGLKKVDKSINATSRQAKVLEKGLKIEFDEGRFVQAQKLAQKALSETEDKAQLIRKQLKYLEETGGIDTAGYQKLQTELAKTETKALTLNKQLEKLNQLKLENVTKKIDNLSKGLATAANKTKGLSIAAAAAGVAMVKLATDAVATGDDIQTTADQFNTSAEAIQKWNYVALQTDVPAEQLYKSISKLRVAIGKGLVGDTSIATDALLDMGLSIEQLSNSDDAFYDVVEALSEVEDTTLRAYYANQLFGEKVATDLVPLLNQGSAALRELSSEFEDVGFISNEQIRSLADLDGELNILKTQFANVKTEIGIAFLPILESLSNFLQQSVLPVLQTFSEWFTELPSGVQNTILAVTALLAVLSPTLLIGSKLLSLTSSLIRFLPSLGKVITAVGTSTGRALIGFVALGTALKLIFDVIENWGNMSSVQRIISVLGLLTIAALGAAVAVGAFQSAWSLGLAVAGIIAGIVAVTAAVNNAKNSIDTSIPSISSSGVSGSIGSSGASNAIVDTNANPTTTNSNIDNSSTVNNITIESNEYMNSDQLVDAVSKKLTLKLQSRS